MTKIFISDLHLEQDRPEITELFLAFLKVCTAAVESLYILGDFFEVWIGDDDLTPFNQAIIAELRNAVNQGLKIYLMHGNRDFLIGKKFLRASGCELLPAEQKINLFGVPTLLMHGDTLCTSDIAYLKFRKKSRNWFFQKLFLLKSLHRRQAIAKHYREKSKAYTSTTPDHIMDVTQSEVERVMQQHHVHYLIHGHTHRPGIHQFKMNHENATRIVLGPWHTHGSAFVCKNDGAQELIEWKTTNTLSDFLQSRMSRP